MKVIDSFGKSSAYRVVETETGLELRKKRMVKSGNGDYRPLMRFCCKEEQRNRGGSWNGDVG